MRQRSISWHGIKTAVACALTLLLGGVGCDKTVDKHWVQVELARVNCQSICASIDRYRRDHPGEIPSIEQLISWDQSLRQFLEGSGLTIEEIPSTFEIVKLPECMHQEGQPRDAYVLIVKRVPNGLEWNTIFVNGKETALE
jgi:hypothetical protein